MLVESADYEATLAENAALKERLRLIECSRDLGLYVRLLEAVKPFYEIHWMTSARFKDRISMKQQCDLQYLFFELIATANGVTKEDAIKAFDDLPLDVPRANEGAK